ncbi:hypothetical protein VW35_02365 [Devosia soli]|uniref:DNA binding HTH domain-containing protein n=1 Tax=Devosia soli TaxID=361041 RepID=A0A0F5LHJ9_9HYPH|nr:helix-turn-helix domain-containing protein [Devosia soli]KKB81032.1 hypothetical protein VW35_02365 [Devosia soli]
MTSVIQSQQSHAQRLHAGISSLSLSPSEVQFHYVRAVLAAEGGCVTTAARRMGLHRRTLQRMLDKRGPKARIEK